MRTAHSPILIVGQPEDVILRALARYRYLTARQLARLGGYRLTSLTYVQTRLKRLTDTGFLQRPSFPRVGHCGSSPLVYTLARKGRQYLLDQGVDVDTRLRPAEEQLRGYLFLAHTLAVNDILIAAELVGRNHPRINLNQFATEHELKQQPVYINNNSLERRKVAVIPDAWLDWRIGVEPVYQECYILEIDRSTEEQRHWRRKVRSLLAYANGPYQERFRCDPIVVAVVAMPTKKRRDDLLRWTEAELKELGREQEADLFRFTELTDQLIAPEELFLSPRWYQPFEERPVPLLGG